MISCKPILTGCKHPLDGGDLRTQVEPMQPTHQARRMNERVGLRKIKKLIDLLEESNLAELEINQGEEAVRFQEARHP